MLRDLLTQKRLLVDSFDFGDGVVRTDRRQLRRLLGAIVYQAMDDGMLRIRVGVSSESGAPHMSYFGPRRYLPGKRIWWEMIPPPSECYPVMLQVSLSMAEVEAGLPINGLIPAIKHGRRLNLSLAVQELSSFEIAWDEEYASNPSDEEDGEEREDTEGGVIP